MPIQDQFKDQYGLLAHSPVRSEIGQLTFGKFKSQLEVATPKYPYVRTMLACGKIHPILTDAWHTDDE